MSFLISALPAEPFAHLFDLSDGELAAHRAVRRVVDRRPGVPCRVSLRDVEIGEPVILVHYEHLPVESPFRASHAIYVSRAERARPAPNEVPDVLRRRLPRCAASTPQACLWKPTSAKGPCSSPSSAECWLRRTPSSCTFTSRSPGVMPLESTARDNVVGR